MKCKCPRCNDNQVDCPLTNYVYRGHCYWCFEHCVGQLLPDRADLHSRREQAALDLLAKMHADFVATCQDYESS